MAALKGFSTQERLDRTTGRKSLYLVIAWGDGTHEFFPFPLPADKPAVIRGLRALAYKLDKPDLAHAGVTEDD